MLYSIVDIETTGHPHNRITEIAIIVSDGNKIIREYEQLINPQCEIPYMITELTGIDDNMVRNSPTFEEVMQDINEVMNRSTFVAHNVSFDYNQIAKQMQEEGVHFSMNKLCTVKLARRHFKGQKSYSLGKLTSSLGIPLQNRHRAMGDAKATCILLHRILKDTAGLFG